MESTEILALDAMGVIYPIGDDLRDLLIPFVRERGCVVLEEEIADVYRKCSRGEVSSKELWQRLGLAEDPETLNHRLVQKYTIDPHVLSFLESCRQKGITVTCLSNDPSEWSKLRRERFGLHRYIQLWVISGDVGSRKPDTAIYHALASETGKEFGQIWFVDDRKVNLEAASRLGMKPVLFNSNPDCRDETGVRVVNGFQELAWLLEL